MITRDMHYRIHFYHTHQRLTVGQIASELGISRSTVYRHLSEKEYHGRKERVVKGKLNDFHEYIQRLLDAHPYSSEQIFRRLCEDGYQGSYSTVRRYVNKVRPVKAKAYFKLNFRPGEASQVDFGYCGKIPSGNRERRLIVFVSVLCYSRYIYAEFIPCERQEHFLQSHFNAFSDFGGVSRKVIVDNCKCAVLKNRRYEEPVYNPAYLDFSLNCGFDPVACNPASPNEKGIVENAVKYIKNSFLTGREFRSIAEANSALRLWLDQTANKRRHAATNRSPVEMLEEERKLLLALPPQKPDCSITKQVRADNRCRIWFDSNSYSVPSKFASQQLTLKAYSDRIIISCHGSVVATHSRSYNHKAEIIDPDHQQDLLMVRKKAAEQNLVRDFLNISSEAEQVMKELELRELNAQLHMRKILTLVNHYGREAVAEVMTDMIHFHAFRSEYVENRLLSMNRKNNETGFLHVPNAGDLLKTELKETDMDLYDHSQEWNNE